MAKILSMHYDTINRWLSRIDKDTIEERNAAIQNLWLRCWTEEEIAEAVGTSQQNVGKLLQQIRKYEIVVTPGMFSDGEPDDDQPEKVKNHCIYSQKSHSRCNSNFPENLRDRVPLPPVYHIVVSKGWVLLLARYHMVAPRKAWRVLRCGSRRHGRHGRDADIRIGVTARNRRMRGCPISQKVYR